MAIQPFVPGNMLEEKLVAAQQGEIDGESFLNSLLESQLFMPIEEEGQQIAGFQRSTTAQPLLLEDAESGQSAIALFTSPERALPVTQGRPGYGGGLMVDLAWIVEKLGGVHPVTINPGWEVGFELDAEVLSAMLGTRREGN
jgi:hypothetical protein